ncbi:uncharacterized protein LOC110105706 [Dendrobium catenatum]|uniref:uncharacterized protein LOC110105706 n=1 Tax=Dendrobium catenatum TaxID=906689 RepID=UPI00109F61B6|nr:uncharacterized protein LOC110105706 [Dendrobium catenatum]
MDCKEASSNAISSKSDIRKSSLPVQNVSFIVQDCFSSPKQVSQKHEFKNKAERNNGAIRSVALTTTTTMDRLFHPSSQIVGKIRGGGHSVVHDTEIDAVTDDILDLHVTQTDAEMTESSVIR